MAAGAGNSGVQQGEGRAGNGRGGREDGSWRQRVVRTFVTVLMRIRAAVVAVFRLRGVSVFYDSPVDLCRQGRPTLRHATCRNRYSNCFTSYVFVPLDRTKRGV